MQYKLVIDNALSQSEEMIDQFLLATDLEGKIIYCNDSFQRVYKLLGEFVSGLPIESILNAKETSLYKNALLNCRQNKNANEKLTFKKPGAELKEESIHFAMRPNLDKNGKIVGVILKGALTRIKPMNENNMKPVNVLKSSLVNPSICFETMADFMPEIMWLTDKQHLLIRVNQAWINFSGAAVGKILEMDG